MKGFYENFRGILYQCDTDLNPHFVKGDVEGITGYTEDDFLSGDVLWTDIVHPDDRERVAAEEVATIPYFHTEDEFRFVKKDGSVIWVKWVAYNVCENDEPKTIQGYMLDITQRKNTEKKLAYKEARFAYITENMNDLVSVFDTKFNLLYINKVQTDFFGFPEDEFGTDTILEYIHPDDRAKINDIPNRIFESGIIRRKARLKKHDEKYVWMDILGKLVKDANGNDVVLFVCRNIDKQKRLMARLKKETRRGDFYRDLLSHDIINILQNIRLSVGLARDNMQNDSQSLSKYFRIIDDQIEQGNSLISNIKKMARIKRDRPHLSPISFHDVLKKSVRDAAEHRTVQIEIENNSDYKEIMANDLLYDVFFNIIHNAVKYNQAEVPKIDISVNDVKQNNAIYAKFEFTDNGTGIADPYKDKVFQKGYKIDKSTSGMGIGLSLVKNIVDLYGGSISIRNRVENDYTSGSVFSIFLPVHDKSAGQSRL